MKALVTGATGCVGANVVAALLRRGHAVRAMHRSTSKLDALDGLEVERVVGNILDPPSLMRAMEGCDWVFHVAAVSDYWRTPPEVIYRVNVEGTRNVVEAALRTGVRRLIYTSSVGALGVPRTGRLLDETCVFNLPPHRFPYGHSKHLAEEVVQEGVRRGLDAVIVNPAAVMGPRDVHWIGGSVLQEVQRGKAWFAPPGGTCWAAATDVGEGHVLAAERGRTGERYLLGGENLTHRQALETVAQVLGRRGPWFTLPRWTMGGLERFVRLTRRFVRFPLSPEQVWLSAREIYCDSRKAVQELGYPQTPFRVAVEEAYRWYRERGWM
ncbi:MAG TPA: NAD-dependent epimerase/dehydratase family protein [Chloroflexi bacterium]|nr:NAD-dependent epimerase/dehydratase family protein [Chloroflexota bacterium]